MVSQKDEAAKKLKSFIRQAQEELERLEEKGKGAWEEVKEQEESFEGFVKKNPLIAVGGALLLGYALGSLLKRRK